jgi:hypothetical protein
MTSLVGAVTLVSAMCGLLLGQITAGTQLAGVVVASLVLISLRA